MVLTALAELYFPAVAERSGWWHIESHLWCCLLHQHKVPHECVSGDKKFEDEVERPSKTGSESVFLHFTAEYALVSGVMKHVLCADEI